MNTPASNLPRRQGTLRRDILPFALFLGLLSPTSFVCAQTSPASGPVGGSAVTPATGSAWTTDQQADLAEFSAWANRYAKAQRVGNAAVAPDATTLAEGQRLAERRRFVYEALAQTDPARARAASVPVAIREKLPPSVLSQLEPAVSTTDVRTQARQVTLPETVYGNDPFGGALQLFDTNGSISDDNIGATKEPGEPNHAGSAGGASVWYVWTPSSSGPATFSTDDGVDHVTVDTLLAVYTGSDVADLAEVVSNDDYDGFNSRVSFYAQGGQTYYIAVDGFLYSGGPSEGSYTLTYFQQGDPLSPTITSDSSAEFQSKTLFEYDIEATNNPLSYSATGLPTGLTLNSRTGVITGTVTEIGNYIAFISATNLHGTSTISLTLSVIDTPTHLPFFRTEVALPQTPGVYYLHLPRGNIFGYYAYLEDDNYIYHYDLGYEYAINANDGKSGIYFYDFASDTFFYSSPTFPFPYMYDFTLNTVLYYYPDPFNDARYNTNGVRYFYNFSTREIITK